MIHLLTGLYANLFSERRCNLLIIGADSAGKSTLLEQIKVMWHPSNGARKPSQDAVARRPIRPTVGLNMARLHRSDLRTNVALWDLGGQANLRPLWSNYFDQCHGILFVIDVTTIEQRHQEIGNLLKLVFSNPQLLSAPLAILFNKTDACADHEAHHMDTAMERVHLIDALLQSKNTLMPSSSVSSAGNNKQPSTTDGDDHLPVGTGTSSCGFGKKTFKCFHVSALTGAGVQDALEWLMAQCRESSRTVDEDGFR